MKPFPKDDWIKDAIVKGYIIVRENGDVFRAKRASKDGLVDKSSGYALIKVQVHRKSGRVYFNMTWRGYTKSVLVNRVVAWRFYPNPDDLPQVNHKNGNKEDNSKLNLEWSSGSDNEKHAHRTGLKSGRGTANSNSKLTPDLVRQIRASVDPVSALATRFGVSRSTINNIKNGKTWTHV